MECKDCVYYDNGNCVRKDEPPRVFGYIGFAISLGIIAVAVEILMRIYITTDIFTIIETTTGGLILLIVVLTAFAIGDYFTWRMHNR